MSTHSEGGLIPSLATLDKVTRPPMGMIVSHLQTLRSHTKHFGTLCQLLQILPFDLMII